MLEITPLLQEAVDEILSHDQDNLFTASITFTNELDPSFLLTEVKIDRMSISQMYASNTSDEIQVNIAILPEDLLYMIANQQALIATIRIDYLDYESGDFVLDEDPEIYEYRVFIHDMENLAKRYNMSAFVNTDHDSETVLEQHASAIIDITIQLMSDESYQLNKAAFVGMLSNVTIENAFKFIAVNMGAKRINMIPAHNTAVIHRVNIPPDVSSYKQVFTYLQKRFGIYTEGLSYYMYKGVLYVYPQYDVNISRPKKLRVIKINPKTMLGLKNYFKDTDEIFSVISNSDVVHKSMANTVMENDGNSQVYVAADKVIDGQVSVLNDSITYNDISRACTNNVNNGVAPESAIPKFKGSTINMFHQTSLLNGTNTEILITGWINSRLFRLTPGMPVEYVYDEKEVTVQVKGILEGTDTVINKMEGSHGGNRPFSSVTSLVLRLDLDSNKTELTTL